MTTPGLEEALSPRLPDDQQAAAMTTPRGCPFLLAEGGGWRLGSPSKVHACAAVSPAASLSLEKQSRLCLTAAYPTCATYLASLEARGTRLGAPEKHDATRWRLTRTTAVIEDAGGVRSRVAAALTDRGRWPAVPAVLLLTGLIVLGLSGLRGTPASAVASPSPSEPATASSQPETVPPTEAANTAEPTIAPTSAPTAPPTPGATATAGPQGSFRVYTVKSGDTLSGIASKFGTTSKAIADLNGIKTSTTLHIGQVLKIPNT
jgi:LysM repeat protein